MDRARQAYWNYADFVSFDYCAYFAYFRYNPKFIYKHGPNKYYDLIFDMDCDADFRDNIVTTINKYLDASASRAEYLEPLA